MKFCYNNDERKPMRVRIMDLNYDHATGKGDFYLTLSPCECRVFEVDIPVGAVIYVKKWQDLVMISYIDQAAVSQLEQEQQRQEAALADRARSGAY